MITNSLTSKVALVAGATRGAGRAIAVALGELGATVYCSGRSTRGHPATGTRPETIEETAELVTARGGRGIAVRTDHTKPDEVRALVDRIREEQGRLDVLVNDIWGGDTLTHWGATLWEHSLDDGLLMIERAVFSHIITSKFAIPLLIEHEGGLVVEVTDGVEDGYRGNIYYDLVKSSVIRLARGLAHELRPHRATALAITPGFLRSEAMLEKFGVTEATWRDHIPNDPHWAESETPLYVGRCVAALAADPNVRTRTGGAFTSWDLAEHYGIVDADGRRPHWGRHIGAATDDRWATLVARLHDRFAESGTNVDVGGDRKTLTLRAGPVTRRVLEPELFFVDHGTIVDEVFNDARSASTA